MGITPIAINEFTGLVVAQLAFDEDLADAVGLTEGDVQIMLDQVHKRAPFGNGCEKGLSNSSKLHSTIYASLKEVPFIIPLWSTAR